MKNLKTIFITTIALACTSLPAEEEKKTPLTKTHEEICQANLIAAEAFLQKNAAQEGVTTLVKDRLQIKTLKKGSGEVCKETDTVIVQYKGSLLDGSIFDQSKADISFPLNAVIIGFKKGLVGMQIGEKRMLYIHPNYGYGDNKKLPFPPNSLLIFEIELKGIK